jgi:hypothetical protein
MNFPIQNRKNLKNQIKLMEVKAVVQKAVTHHLLLRNHLKVDVI